MATADEATLSERKREALAHAREGKSTKEIAEAMGVTYNAANEHIRSLRSKGFLPKSRRRRGRRSAGPKPVTPTPVVSSNGGGRVGHVVVETLRRAVNETDEAIEANQREMAMLSERQHEIAEETNTLADLRQDLDGRVKSLA